MKLVVGLGNPGKKYKGTRHNIGFDVVTAFALNEGGSAPSKSQYGALVGSQTFAGDKVILAMPQKYMNLSGQPVASLMGYYKIAAEDVVVVHDEIALAFETVRCKRGGGHGGHNGLRDIIKHIGNGFLRVRMGVGAPIGDQAAYVLGRFNSSEQSFLDGFITRGCDAIAHVLREGIVSAMNTFNVRN